MSNSIRRITEQEKQEAVQFMPKLVEVVERLKAHFHLTWIQQVRVQLNYRDDNGWLVPALKINEGEVLMSPLIRERQTHSYLSNLRHEWIYWVLEVPRSTAGSNLDAPLRQMQEIGRYERPFDGLETALLEPLRTKIEAACSNEAFRLAMEGHETEEPS